MGVRKGDRLGASKNMSKSLFKISYRVKNRPRDIALSRYIFLNFDITFVVLFIILAEYAGLLNFK